jgi:hypothetical protein
MNSRRRIRIPRSRKMVFVMLGQISTQQHSPPDTRLVARGAANVSYVHSTRYHRPSGVLGVQQLGPHGSLWRCLVRRERSKVTRHLSHFDLTHLLKTSPRAKPVTEAAVIVNFTSWSPGVVV